MHTKRGLGAMVLVAVAALSACGSDGSGSTGDQDGRPTEAVRTFQGAQQDRDCEVFADAFTERFLEASAFESREGAVQDCENASPASGSTEYEYLSEEIDGDTAQVEVGWTSPSSSGTIAYELVLDGESWLIDSYAP